MDKLQQLKKQLQTIAKYDSALALLTWDEEVKMPPKAHHYRGEVHALLSEDLHARVVDDQLYQLVMDLQAEAGKYPEREQAMIRGVVRELDEARKLPAEFVGKMARLSTKSYAAWVRARKNDDFSIFSPVLEEVVALKKQKAELLGYEKTPYNALLDLHEMGMTTDMLDNLLNPLADKLAELISAIKQPKEIVDEKIYPIEKQKKLNLEIAKAIGYDLGAGRIDASPHPFTIQFHPTDVRITTRYDEKDFWVSLGSVIHEVGHALYEQGLPPEEHGNPLGHSVSLGIHESQSRSWENLVGRSRSFSSYLYPLLKKHFGELPYTEDELYLKLNRVKPNLIRVESDEVTYNLHIVIRYQIEKDLIEGKIAVADLPHIWNEKIKKYLGLKVPNDAAGVLQDVHWSHGSFGYFPTYTLGNIYSAQFFAKAKTEIPGLVQGFAEGHFSTYLEWLRHNIHRVGGQYTPSELVQKVTDQPLSAEFLIKHLEEKIKSISAGGA